MRSARTCSRWRATRDAAIASYRRAAGRTTNLPEQRYLATQAARLRSDAARRTEGIDRGSAPVRPLPSRAMLATRAPGQSRRELARELLARKDDFGVALVLILLTIIVFASATSVWDQLVSVALSGGTLLFVLHTAGAHRRTFRASAGVVSVAILSAAIAVLLGDTVATATAGFVGLLLAIVAPIVILRRIVLSPTITVRLVLGALSIYLLLGLAYAYLFPLIATLSGRAVLRPDDDAQRLRLHLFQLHDAGHDRVRRLHGGDQPRDGWSRCPRVSSGSSTSSRPWRCSSATSDVSCGPISQRTRTRAGWIRDRIAGRGSGSRGVGPLEPVSGWTTQPRPSGRGARRRHGHAWPRVRSAE